MIFYFMLLFGCRTPAVSGSSQNIPFHVLAFYTGRNDLAHISFMKEANLWFAQKANEHGFVYDTTSNWKLMTDTLLARYEVVIFLDSRPEEASQREAFKQFIEKGGGWMGFHFAGFSLTPSAYPQNWNWYHNDFLGTGQYKSNTWRPTAAILRREDSTHPATKNLPSIFRSSPNEWYRWERDLRENKNIRILLSIDSSSFPLGTGPKLHEIWHNGYYPVAWTNTNYRMVYMNMGHNDIDYESGSNKDLSHTFNHPIQDRFILNVLLWLGKSN